MTKSKISMFINIYSYGLSVFVVINSINIYGHWYLWLLFVIMDFRLDSYWYLATQKHGCQFFHKADMMTLMLILLSENSW